MVLLPSQIAFFILATVQPIGKRYEGSMYSMRMEQIHMTWGSYFPQTYFVMGRNLYDYDFLTENCAQVSTEKFIADKTYSHEHGKIEKTIKTRKLVAKTKQIQLMHKMDGYFCPMLNKSSSPW